MPQGSLADRVTRWRTLSDALAADLDEFPHLKDTHAEFHSAVTTIEALMVEEDQHTAEQTGGGQQSDKPENHIPPPPAAAHKRAKGRRSRC